METIEKESMKVIDPETKKVVVLRTYMGRPPKLSKKDMETLRHCIENQKICNVKEVQEYIKEKFNVSYSSKEVREILKKFNLNYYLLLRKYTYESYYNEMINRKFEF
ncbi:transposase [Acidiplasma aeolicum]|uniref:Transposase n=1 Tax=Acidiplasma aeolicum TaxID=507754 RepID=A0A0P9GX09_9ARCH|nr:winged helix-turn-helix domain-containing protein [Acidiplasma aeolicum]KPV45910.1 transposase [Acidiplasma aeolicum]